MSLFLDGLHQHLRERGDQLALWSRGEDLRLRFTDLAAWSEELSRAIGQGEPAPIGVATGNCAAFCVLFLALRRLAIPFVGIDASLSFAQKLELCRRLGIARLIHREGPAPGDCRELGRGLFLSATLPLAEATRPPQGTALIKLTSGSTGEPLGACFDEASLWAGIGQIAAGMEISAADRVLLTIPLSHSYGFDNGVLSLCRVGTPLVLEPSFYPAAVLRALKESEATFLPLVPPLVRAIALSEPDERWSDLALRRVICAGGTLLPENAAAFRTATGRPVHNFFGSTETGGISFESAPLDPAAFGTVGFPLPGVELDIDGDGRLAIDSAANTIGHFGRDFERRQQKVATGDLAAFTAEGRLRLLGRSADILNIGGRKVSAVAIESALRALPGVQEAAVVGVEDPVRGDRCVAFLVAESWPIDVSSLPPLFQPRELHRLDNLPYTERGKVDRGELRRKAGRERG